ncbi:hypothetical protein OSB04_021932 [Centaurea solstitialis]|uniref:Uncharacterized protein n=1 Tax=Centaurea solstitialis TaxID=347529 RepID=A0AA38SV47_9ASTR|nr:hypothetical protein OSB04_021932 [Centaurea solstitialis]
MRQEDPLAHFLFILATKEFSVVNLGVRFPIRGRCHFVGEWAPDNAKNLFRILKCFEKVIRYFQQSSLSLSLFFFSANDDEQSEEATKPPFPSLQNHISYNTRRKKLRNLGNLGNGGLKIDGASVNVFVVVVVARWRWESEGGGGVRCGGAEMVKKKLGNMNLAVNWHPLIDKFKSTFSGWKAATLSMQVCVGQLEHLHVLTL